MKKTLIFKFILAFICCSPLISAEKNTVAVIDFEGKNVSAMDAVVVTDFLRTAMVNNAYFEVTDRNNMEKILAEQGFQQMGCTTQECAVKIGNILNVQKIVFGSLSKLGQTYYITANIVDIETGKISVSDRVKSSSQSELDFAMETLAKRLEAKSMGKKIGSSVDTSRPPQRVLPVTTYKPKTETAPFSPPMRKTVRRRGKRPVFGLGGNIPGVGIKIGSYNRHGNRAVCVEFKYQTEDEISVYGMRVYGYLHNHDLLQFYMGGEIGYTGFSTDITKVRGGIGMPFIGVEFFPLKIFSLQLDIGPAFYLLHDFNYDITLKGYELCANAGMNIYFAGF